MIQNIIVTLIILAALAYAGYSVYRSVRPGDKPKSACGGCTGCELKNLNHSCRVNVSQTERGVNNKTFSQKLYPFKL
jgi:hypothetical protein